MSREIKFRAWDCDNEVMSFTGLSFNNIEGLRHSLDSFEDYFGRTYFNDNPSYLMQFTGLKDKNGVDIYEGDIIELPIAYNCEYEYKRPENVFRHNIKNAKIEVCFCQGVFQLCSDFIPDDLKALWLWDNLEVIGNIHQNKEL